MISLLSLTRVSLSVTSHAALALAKNSALLVLPAASNAASSLSASCKTPNSCSVSLCLSLQNFLTFSETWILPASVSEIHSARAFCRPTTTGATFVASAFRDAPSRALMNISMSGETSSSCRISRSALLAALKAMVAGANDGAGAVEVVLVRDNGDRDWSSKATIAYMDSGPRAGECNDNRPWGP